MIKQFANILGILINAIYRVTNNYGFTIIVFTLVSKVILFPINILIQKNSIKMVKIKPKLEELKYKYSENKEKFMEEQIALFEKEKYKPSLGIIPLLIQIPIILALIKVVENPNTYIQNLNSMQFLNMDLSIIPTLRNYSIIPILSLVSCITLCYFQNKLNVLQKEESIKLTGAQKGTLLHLCMQKLDEGKYYDLAEIKKLIIDLEQREIITQKEAENINPMAVLKFTQSKIWEEMKYAKEIQKEKPFYINVPAKEVYQEDVPESILVQGIIDLYYINRDNELILVDYKTDFVQTGQELICKYNKQLELYKEALEKALSRKVNGVYIYSTCLGEAIEVR